MKFLLIRSCLGHFTGKFEQPRHRLRLLRTAHRLLVILILFQKEFV